MELFWEHGYEGASLGQLAAAMEINPPSLYAAYGSKEQLFREAVNLYNSVEGYDADQALRNEPTARRAIEVMLRGYAKSYADPATPPGCMIVLAANTGTPQHQAVRELLADLRRATSATMRNRVSRGITDGDVARDTDTAKVAAFYSAVLQGLSIQARDGATHADLDGIVDAAMAAWPALAGNAGRGSSPVTA